MTKATKLPTYHVLDFYHDNDNSCALTILVNQTRYHIIADIDKLRGPITTQESKSVVWQEYSRLLSNLKKAANGDDNDDEGSLNQSTDSGVDMKEPNKDSKSKTENPPPPSTTTIEEAEHEMHEWLLQPLATTIGEAALASKKEELPTQTLEDWYNCETLFFSLDVKSGTLEALELESSPDLQRRMAQLRPSLKPVPKYIQEIDIPWYSPKDLALIHCSEAPPPYRPSIVQLGATEPDGVRKQFFFKTVNNADPQPTKREIKLLHEIAKKGLHDRIKCPQLVGIVAAQPQQPQDDDGDNNGDDKSPTADKHGPIMGFLQTLIPSPTPLTEKFNSDIPQAQRDEWARRAEEMKNVLHENDIIWGDAKGDNFVVDEAGELWIIDFGGSYTEGWVDQEVVETQKGDDMGVEKIVNALHDPEANVVAPESDGGGGDDDDEGTDEARDEAGLEVTRVPVEKRERKKRRHGDEAKEDEKATQQGVKRRKRSTTNKPSTGEKAETEASQGYCYCNGPSAGTMIGCDGEDCEKEWFHLECTDLQSLPEEHEAWFCRHCKV